MKLDTTQRAIATSTARAATHAENIASATTPAEPRDHGPAAIVSLSSEVVGMMEAQRSLEANVQVLREADEMMGDLLDILG